MILNGVKELHRNIFTGGKKNIYLNDQQYVEAMMTLVFSAIQTIVQVETKKQIAEWMVGEYSEQFLEKGKSRPTWNTEDLSLLQNFSDPDTVRRVIHKRGEEMLRKFELIDARTREHFSNHLSDRIAAFTNKFVQAFNSLDFNVNSSRLYEAVGITFNEADKEKLLAKAKQFNLFKSFLGFSVMNKELTQAANQVFLQLEPSELGQTYDPTTVKHLRRATTIAIAQPVEAKSIIGSEIHMEAVKSIIKSYSNPVPKTGEFFTVEGMSKTLQGIWSNCQNPKESPLQCLGIYKEENTGVDQVKAGVLSIADYFEKVILNSTNLILSGTKEHANLLNLAPENILELTKELKVKKAIQIMNGLGQKIKIACHETGSESCMLPNIADEFLMLFKQCNSGTSIQLCLFDPLEELGLTKEQFLMITKSDPSTPFTLGADYAETAIFSRIVNLIIKNQLILSTGFVEGTMERKLWQFDSKLKKEAAKILKSKRHRPAFRTTRQP